MTAAGEPSVMRTVCCAEFGPPEKLQRIEVPRPEPEANQVRVKIGAAGVGFVDGLMIQGKYQIKPPLPYFPGSEFAGEVDACGSGVTHLQPGDRVMGLVGSGAFADYLLAPANSLIAIPSQLSTEVAAGFFINYATALYGFAHCGALGAEDTVLILGAAGGVGSAAICVARATGARVIAAASSAEKRQAALDFGADEVIDYSQEDWRSALKKITENSGLQMVYDPVGGAVAEPAFRSLSPGGKHLVVGFASGEIPKLPFNLALLKQSSLVGVDWGGASRSDPQLNHKLMQTLMAWVSEGKLKPAAVVSLPMNQYQMGLKRQLAGEIVGKLVLTNSD
jgi:NADPH:quinone reductase